MNQKLITNGKIGIHMNLATSKVKWYRLKGRNHQIKIPPPPCVMGVVYANPPLDYPTCIDIVYASIAPSNEDSESFRDLGVMISNVLDKVFGMDKYFIRYLAMMDSETGQAKWAGQSRPGEIDDMELTVGKIDIPHMN